MIKKHVPIRIAASLTVAAALWATPTVAGPAEPAVRTIGEVVRLDPRLRHLVPADAVIEVLADGFRWSEGPVWDRERGRVLFSDIPNNTVHSWSEAEGLTVFLKPSGYTGDAPFEGREPGSNGLAFDSTGHLVLCQHGDRRVARLEDPAAPMPPSMAQSSTAPSRRSSFVTLADRFEGKRFNSPNDLVFAADGSVYFTDPPYGRPKTFDDPGRELDWCGVYRLAPDGQVSLVVEDLKAPNGIGLSPDGKTLYVNQSRPEAAYLMAYAVQPDGSVEDGRVLFDMTSMVGPESPGLPDGLKIDQQGHIFATGPGGVLVFTPGGTHLGTIRTGVPTANCGFGDDGSTLYITANDMLCRIRLTTKGLGF